jgi:hypothetical protein
MRKSVIALSAVAAFAMAGFMPQVASAVPLGNPSGIAAAQEDIGTLDTVHCVPGWPHHYTTRWRRANGCPRVGVFIGPSYRSFAFHRGHRFHRFHHRHW